jgi:hypothetical protein
MKKIAILIPSFRPNLFFDRILPILHTQIINSTQSSKYQIEIFVLIPAEINLDIYAKQSDEMPFHLLRSNESGFSIPRNLLWNAAQSFDVNIFLDDDQIPHKHWIMDLLNGIEANPNYSVYFGDIHFTIPINSPEKSFSKLLPPDRLGTDIQVLTVNHGIANSAIVRQSIAHLINPFRLDFNDGGEDISFFTSLKGMGCTFFELSGCAVTEEWELTRLEARALINRNRRGISAYYRLQQESEPHTSGGNFQEYKTYGRIFLAVLLSPLLFCILVLNHFNPLDVFKTQVLLYLSKIYHVSTIPWKLQIARLFGDRK